jgi:hypothetical protein
VQQAYNFELDADEVRALLPPLKSSPSLSESPPAPSKERQFEEPIPTPPPERAGKTIPLRQLVRIVAAFHRFMPLDDALVQAKNRLGSGGLAARDLTKHARAGRLTVAGRRFGRGDVEQVVIFRSTFWQYFKILSSSLPSDVNRLEAGVWERASMWGSRLPGRWYFFVGRRRFHRHYSIAAPGKPVAQRSPPKQSQPQSPKLTSSEPAVASEEELHGVERAVWDVMRDDPPHKKKPGSYDRYANRIWNGHFKKKGVPLKTIQNFVSKHRKEFEVEADVRDTQKPSKKSSRRK